MARQKDSKIKKIEKSIRTIAWFNSILLTSGLTSAYQFTEAHGDDKRIWGYYAKGTSLPNQEIIKWTEKKFPRTQEIFEDGPENSAIFKSMFDNLDSISNLLGPMYDIYYWLGHLIPWNTLNQIDDDALHKTVRDLQYLYFKEFSEESEYEPKSHLSFLSGCIIVFRYAINRDRYVANSHVDSLIDIIVDCFAIPEVVFTLEIYGIHELVLKWLKTLINEWCIYSHTGKVFSDCGSIPSDEEFLKKPTTFVLNYHKAIIEYKKRHGDLSDSDVCPFYESTE